MEGEAFVDSDGMDCYDVAAAAAVACDEELIDAGLSCVIVLRTAAIAAMSAVAVARATTTEPTRTRAVASAASWPTVTGD